MLAYIFKRLWLMIPTLFGVLLLSFIVIQFVPGGPIEQALYELKHSGAQQEASSGNAGSSLTNTSGYQGRSGVREEYIDALKQQYGFDKPAHERFWIMIKQYAQFNLGDSFFYHKSVGDLILEKLPVSISLGFWSFLLTYLIAIPLGIGKAVRDGSRFDAASSVALLIAYAVPSFVLGVILLVLFGGGSFMSWFPLRGLVSDNFDELSWGAKIIDYAWHLALPVFATVVSGLASLVFLTKNTFLEEMSKAYVITARAKGLSERVIFYRHVLRNALLPIIASLPGALIASFFASSLLIETLFSLDGLGQLGYEAIMRRDYPVVMGSLYIFTLLGLLIKLLTDVLYVWIDPRVRFSAGKI
jgi:microcin C transport system permease protein